MITTSGTIGAGKTTWSELIAEHFGVEVYRESVDENPFLAKYYEDPEKYSFHLQVYFLNHRFRAIKEAMKHPNNVLDRSIYEDSMIFAKLQFENGSMDEESYKAYLDLHENMMQELHDLGEMKVLKKKSPDLLVHLDGSLEEILRRVKKRGREFEQIDQNPGLEKYYRDLYKLYEGFVEEYKAQEISPVYVLDIDKYSAEKPEDVAIVMKEIEAALAEARGELIFDEKLAKDIMWGDYDPEKYELVEDAEDWEVDGKYQNSSIIFKHKASGKHYKYYVTRSGSPFTDYEYYFDDDVFEVEYKEEVKLVKGWVSV
ncbi:deoxynucleoside kinase [Bacillus wiedmannii]|uniref:deoxynucleoside kinase n=1 Tax=Bacillus wiedmannii TaxID=1890302 RepID=UPI001F0B36EB|nr:deoxynucleoside kinase [Bacillus wiedmannii]